MQSWLAQAGEAARASTDKLKGFGLAESTGTPGFGRIIVVVLLVAALAWAAAWLLRRYGPRFRIGPAAGPSPIRRMARSSLPGGITCHLVEAQGACVLITVSRHGVSSVQIGTVTPPTKEPTP